MSPSKSFPVLPIVVLVLLVASAAFYWCTRPKIGEQGGTGGPASVPAADVTERVPLVSANCHTQHGYYRSVVSCVD